jgi:hypothetical protein
LNLWIFAYQLGQNLGLIDSSLLPQLALRSQPARGFGNALLQSLLRLLFG